MRPGQPGQPLGNDPQIHPSKGHAGHTFSSRWTTVEALATMPRTHPPPRTTDDESAGLTTTRRASRSERHNRRRPKKAPLRAAAGSLDRRLSNHGPADRGVMTAISHPHPQPIPPTPEDRQARDVGRRARGRSFGVVQQQSSPARRSTRRPSTDRSTRAAEPNPAKPRT